MLVLLGEIVKLQTTELTRVNVGQPFVEFILPLMINKVVVIALEVISGMLELGSRL